MRRAHDGVQLQQGENTGVMMTERQAHERVLAPGIAGRSRARVTAQYALMPAEGILASALPGFHGTTVRVQTAPPMGARFAQMLLEIVAGGGTSATRDDGLEHVFFVVSGSLTFTLDDSTHVLTSGGYVFVPVGHRYGLHNAGDEECR